METVCEPTSEEAIAAVAAALDTLQAVGITPADAAEARALIVGLEAVARRVRSVQVDLVGEVDKTGAHVADGHASAKVMVRHVAQLSAAEADRRARCARSLRALPEVRSAFASGAIGACQVERISRAHANPRVREAVEANDTSFAEQAGGNEYLAFDRMVDEWVRLVDEDGTRDRDQSAHEKRDARLVQGFDGSWELVGRCASLAGAELRSIFEAYLRVETLADWEKARATHGEAATPADLPRTEAQRRFDAIEEVFRHAASHHAAHGGSQIVTDIVIDQATFAREVARLSGTVPAPADPSFPTVGRRCSTLDGRPVEATSAVAHALVGEVRRVVVGSGSVVIDLGRRRRLFTGAAALAVRLSSTTCYWPGCHVPVSDCQGDHLVPWATGGGSTSPRNGGPACGRHNRLRNHGHTTWRDPDGTWHVARPDGTEVT